MISFGIPHNEEAASMGRGSQEIAAEYRYLKKAIQVEVREGADGRHLWEALAARLPVGDGLPSRRELADLRREYEFTRAVAARMVEVLSVYQVFVLAVLLGVGTYVYNHFAIAQNADLPWRLLQGAFWGALGATAGSLWGLNKHAGSRTLRLDTMANHLLKPLLGAVMGVLAILFLPAIGGFAGGTGGESAPSLTAYGIAALAGLFEQSFIRKFQAIVDAVLGAGNGPTIAAPAPALAESDLALTDEEQDEVEDPQRPAEPVNEVAAKAKRSAARKPATTKAAAAEQPPEQNGTD
jgi:hypothetical protein